MGRGRWESLSPDQRADWLAQWDAAGRAAGLHSDRHDGVCSVCRRVVPAIVFVGSAGGGGIAGSPQFCTDCAPKGPTASEAVVHARVVAGRYGPRDVWTLADALIWWGKDHAPEAFAAVGRNASDDDYCSRVVAQLYRLRAAADADWVDASLIRWPAEVRGLAPLIRVVNGWRFDAVRIEDLCALLGIAATPSADDGPPPARPAPSQIGTPAPPPPARPAAPPRRAQARRTAGATEGPALFGGGDR
jgi:hypothetical protein